MLTKDQVLGLIENFRGDKKTLQELQPILKAILALAVSGGNVQSDWAQTDSDAEDYIKNKPTLPTKVSDLSNDADFIAGDGISNVVAISQDDYDELSTKAPTTLYVILKEES